MVVSGLPPSGSWQDLKDHMREAGDVCYADVYRDGTGVVEFVRKEDMTYAIRKLDNTKFRSHEGETAYIRVKADGPRSPSYGRSRSQSCSCSRSLAEATAGVAVTPQGEAEDLHAILPVIADLALVHKMIGDTFCRTHVVYSFPLLNTIFFFFNSKCFVQNGLKC